MQAVARYAARDVHRATGIKGAKLSSVLDRGLVRLCPEDREAAGSGNRRKFCAATIKKIALLHELSAAGVVPKIAARIAADFYSAQAEPGDLLVVDRDGGARLVSPSDFKPGACAQVVIDLGMVLGNVNAKLAVAS